MSSSDLVSCPSAPAQYQDTYIPRLFGAIRLAADQKQRWETDLDSLLDQLMVERDKGTVGNTFENRGWSFCWSPGETEYEWPASIIELEASLLEAKRAAVKAGTAVQKPPTPFWIVRRPKASQKAQEAA